mgnify:CR=1 FL=1
MSGNNALCTKGPIGPPLFRARIRCRIFMVGSNGSARHVTEPRKIEARLIPSRCDRLAEGATSRSHLGSLALRSS